jgi:hypothetical protein
MAAFSAVAHRAVKADRDRAGVSVPLAGGDAPPETTTTAMTACQQAAVTSALRASSLRRTHWQSDMACKIMLVDDEPELLAIWEQILRPLPDREHGTRRARNHRPGGP